MASSKIHSFIILIIIILVIGSIVVWWIIVEKPKTYFKNIKKPPPCPASNPRNQDPTDPCIPPRQTFPPSS